MQKFNNYTEGTVISISFSIEELTTLFNIKYAAPQVATELQSQETDEQIEDAIKFIKEAGTLAKNIISCIRGETK